MHYLPFILTVAFIHLLGVMSPGPDFIMVIRNSLVYSKRTGIFTALGFAFGILVHISYSLAGLALIISKSILVFNFIKWLGAGYLIYIGIVSWRSKGNHLRIEGQDKKPDISAFKAIKIGFLTNVLNPKATLYFLSLFTFIISPTTPAFLMLILTIVMFAVTVAWFSFVAIVLNQPKIRAVFERYQGVFNKTFGGVLIALGIKVAVTER